jgi:probable phosphoglycerate mutase
MPPLEDPDAYHVTFVRHAESEGNVNGLWQGQAEYPLSETGRAQARALSEYLFRKGERFDAVFSSPLTRARDTAAAVAEKLNLSVLTDPIWLERDNGRWAGTTHENRFPPEPDYLFLHHPTGETGETQWELFLRGGQALARLLNRPPGRYLVASHGGILNMALHAALGIAPFANYQGVRFTFANSSVTTATYIPARNRWLLTSLNDLSHLEAPETWAAPPEMSEVVRDQIE